MIIFRPFKKIKELEKTNRHLRQKIEQYEELERKRREGRHVTGAYCKGCLHHKPSGNGENTTAYGSCKLDFICKDREIEK